MRSEVQIRSRSPRSYTSRTFPCVKGFQSARIVSFMPLKPHGLIQIKCEIHAEAERGYPALRAVRHVEAENALVGHARQPQPQASSKRPGRLGQTWRLPTVPHLPDIPEYNAAEVDGQDRPGRIEPILRVGVPPARAVFPAGGKTT